MRRMPKSGSRDLRTRVYGAAGAGIPRKRGMRPPACRGKSYLGKASRPTVSTKIGLE